MARASCDHRRVLAAPLRLRYRSSALVIMFVSGCGGAPRLTHPTQVPADALQITGTARLDELSEAGMEHIEVSLLLTYWWSAPITSFLLRVDAINDDGAPEAQLVQIPVARPGFAAPKALPIHVDGFLSLQEPVELVPLSNGKRWLALTGQVVNVSGRELTLKRFRLVVRREGGAPIVDRELRTVSPIVNNAATVVPFVVGLELPSDVTDGTITLDAAVTMAGDAAPRPLSRSLAFAPASPMRLSPPVLGTWIWRNGPGEQAPSVHTPWPEQRYAYDLSVVRDVAGKRTSFDGDANRNESFFAWDQPILAAADGTVVEVVDDVTDNPGRTANPGGRWGRNARIVLRHGQDRFTVYLHLRKGSAVVRAGQEVKAGDVIGRVGNAGFSTEPHLHFACFKIDATGRPRALPMEMAQLKTESGDRLSGVPVSGLSYVSE
jgi:murein DD-endopeptidase MepM/ murein hydrolase activator NlpD